MQIVIAVPSHDKNDALFTADLANLCLYSAARVPGCIDLNHVPGTYVHVARDRLAREAIASDASHVLWLDADMRFPRTALFDLLSRNCDIVGINYTTRGEPPGFVARNAHGPVRTMRTSSGLEEVERIGFGLVLMRAEVLRQLLDDPLLFFHDWGREGIRWQGEDFTFCARARAAGFAIFVDHDLSKECAHIGIREFRTTDVQEAI